MRFSNGLDNPGPHQSEWVSFHSNQILRECSVSSSRGENPGNGESFGAFSYQHHVTGMLHHCPGHQRDILDIAHASDRPRPPRGTVHAAGVQFDHAFFVRQPAQSDAVIVGIVLRPLNDSQRGLERIAAALRNAKASSR